jgi:hypothetical protein
VHDAVGSLERRGVEAELLLRLLLGGDAAVEVVEAGLGLGEQDLEHDDPEHEADEHDEEQRAEHAGEAAPGPRLLRRHDAQGAPADVIGPGRGRGAGRARGRGLRGAGAHDPGSGAGSDAGSWVRPSASAARRRALSARGLWAISVAVGIHAPRLSSRRRGDGPNASGSTGSPGGTCGVADAARRRSLTMRSSPEW